MVGLKAELYDIHSDCIELRTIHSMELCRDIDAACDGLRLNFLHKSILPELYRIVLYYDDKKIFNGYIDTQRETINENGYACFLYARSSACLLTDNASEPITYFMPSVNAVFNKNAENLGIKNKLENLCSTGQYQVSNGVSCYGAINSFVYALTGKNVMVNPDNEMVMITAEQKVYIPKDTVLMQKRVINRAQAVSRIDYKINSDTDYKYHLRSNSMYKNKITNSLIKNVSAVPEWQKERLISNSMKKANENYYCLELTLSGYADVPLNSAVQAACTLAGDDVWCVKSVTYTLGSDGLYTGLTLFKEIDLEEIMYVDE